MLTIEVKEHTHPFFTPLLSFLGQALCTARGDTKVKRQEISPRQLHNLVGSQTLQWFALEQLALILPIELSDMEYGLWPSSSQIRVRHQDRVGNSHMVRVPMSHDTPCDLSITSELLCHFLTDTKAFGVQSALIPYI